MSTPHFQPLDSQERTNGPAPYGSPTAKSRCTIEDVASFCVSMLCLAGCFVVVQPDWYPAWWLGFNNQLVVIGLLMSIMNLCNSRVTSQLFIALETRQGATLQNLDAILQQSATGAKTDWVWRIAIAASIGLPLVLSALYKTFSNGRATLQVYDYSLNQYGVFSRPLENDREQTYILIDAMTPWRREASSDDNYPENSELPKLFGHNMVMLGQEEVVVLDMPNSTILGEIQETLLLNEYLLLSANINGTLSKYNSSTVELLQDDDFWKPYMGKTTTLETYEGWRVAMARGARPQVWGVVGGFRHLYGEPVASNDSWVAVYSDWESPQVSAFRNSNFSMMFNLYRQPCAVTWNVSSSEVVLASASCDMDSLQPIEEFMLPEYYDIEDKTFMDALPFAISPFWKDRPFSPWKMPSAAMSVAALHVNRWRHMLRSQVARVPNTTFVHDFRYPDASETFRISRHTIDAKPLLYVVFAVQPVLTTIMLLLTYYFYSTPVSSNFGLTSILASVDKDSLAVLSGAGLSGKLKERIFLDIQVAQPDTSNTDKIHGKIVSTLDIKRHKNIGKIEAGKKYA